MNFDPSNHFLNIWKSLETVIPKMGARLGVYEFIFSHSFALSKVWMWLLDYTFGLHILHAFCLGHDAKIRVVTTPTILKKNQFQFNTQESQEFIM
jgi:hypothetical protein